MPIIRDPDCKFDVTCPILIVGAGACGLVAALAAHDAGIEPIVLERDGLPQGSTALSSGMIPACETDAQANEGVDDSIDIFAEDILTKAKGQTDAAMVRHLCAQSGPSVNWLIQQHDIPLSVVTGFLYPGHRKARMHAPPSRTGAELMGALSRAAGAAGIDVLTDALVEDLIIDNNDRIIGLRFRRPDASQEVLGCETLILACNGYGGNTDLLAELIPKMATANFAGHVGNQGEAILWGRDLGADMADLGSFQGHGSLAHPHNILISWALMMEGGIQVNIHGQRFSNEHDGYSEQAQRVIAQPDSIAFAVFDDRLHQLGLEFEDYRDALSAGALRSGDSLSGLAEACGLPIDRLTSTFVDCETYQRGEKDDPFGRNFQTKPTLRPPYHAIKVTGSLFHTQGGLIVDAQARVCRPDGTKFPNLYAGGGAARGLSGPSDWGYLSGNGLLTAVTLGHIAGREAAAQIQQARG